MAGNTAIQTNPNGVQLGITVQGSDFLWSIFGAMLLSDLVVLAWHFTVPRGQRVFHQLVMIILTTASVAYFCLASNLGATPIATEFAHGSNELGVGRAIWYVRYIDWVITTPALLLTLVLASGLPLSDIITLVFFDLVMIVTGLVGALVSSSYKWGFFAFAMFAEFYIWWVLLGPARSSAGIISKENQKAFTTSAVILSFLWLLYPVAWGLADGGNVIHPDSEMVFYGVLDFFAKPVYSFIHLYSLSKVDLTALQLSSGKFTTSAAGVSAYDREKHANPVTVHENNYPTAQGAAAAKANKSRFGRRSNDVAPARTSDATVAA